MAAYDRLAPFYDAGIGSQKETIQQVRKWIKQYYSKSRTLLDVACGTGTVLKALSKSFHVCGIDRSSEMLSIAQKKIPKVPLFQTNMKSLKLGMTFDIILCLYDAVNHLKSLNEWKTFFGHVKNHLNPNGLFIFDINTESKLKRLSQSPSWVHQFGAEYLITNVTQKKKNIFSWDLRLFKKKSGHDYSFYHEKIEETAYPTSLIKKSLSPYFKILKSVSENEEARKKSIDRVYFISRKK